MLINLLGYPSSAAAYCVGVEQAPQALRDAGLVQRCVGAGHQVRDAGDLPVRAWRPDHASPLAQNVDEEVRALRELVAVAAPLLGRRRVGERLLVLGGSCTVAVGMCAAMSQADLEPQLVYVDRHLDLNTPASTLEGSLSWMGMAHALGVDGAVEQLAGLGGGRPLLRPEHLSYLGVDVAGATDFERDQVESRGLHVTDQAALVTDPPRAARRARGALPGGPFLVHVDVDVLEFQDAPLAENVNGRNTGPTLVQLGRALAALWSDPDCLGLTLGQLVPAHAASDPTAIDRFLEAILPSGSDKGG